MPRAIIYCRVSTKEQVQNLSLPTQKQECMRYCERNGFEVAEVFVDEGESAKTIDRPEFQRLIEYCRKNRRRVQFLVVYNLSRFSRHAHDHALVRGLLLPQGVSLRSATEPIDDTSTGEFMETILSAVAQFDNDVRSDRTKAGMKAALERGRWTWQSPLGYRRPPPGNGSPSLVPELGARAEPALPLGGVNL